jgi:hypothetical protein
MKYHKTIFSILLLTLTLVAAGVMAGNDEKTKGSPKQKDFFRFKTDKALVGAQVQVFYSNGELLTTQKLLKKKMIIDFAEARLGTYTIRVTKGESAKEYQFIKR